MVFGFLRVVDRLNGTPFALILHRTKGTRIRGGSKMSNQPKIQVWIIDGQLLTNRPRVFARNFDLPKTAPVDGLTRVSHRLAKLRPKEPSKGD